MRRRHTRRPGARLWAAMLTTLVVSGLVLIPGQARACACGAAYPVQGDDLAAGPERALLSWTEDHRERLEMALSLTGDGADAAVLIPTPAAPRVAQGDLATFDELDRLTSAPRETAGAADAGDGAGAPQQAPSVLSRTVLDDVVATVLTGGSPRGVTRWLDRHGYAHKPQVRPVIGEYLRAGWVLTAVKLRADRAFDGAIDPMVLTFDSDRLVYPMRLSSTAAEVEPVTIYTLDDVYDVRTDSGTAGQVASMDAYLRLDPDQVRDATLRRAIGDSGQVLTRWTYTTADPASLTADFAFGSSHTTPEESWPDLLGRGDSGGAGESWWPVALGGVASGVLIGLVVLGLRRLRTS
ncbi:MAG: DUF2330 domain-containing protein [Nocardioides sp.]|uniref:DUF2330 domain-containing protein n=1 Tax=Nocardioides sp. TaxID=35761 RepID=UPI0039E3E765